MTMFKDLLKGPAGGFLLGVGVTLLAPVVLPVVGQIVRPLAKAALYAYFNLVDELKSLATDEKPTSTPVLGSLVSAGVGETATTAGEAAEDEEVADVVLESVATALEVV
jgi:hypothetical protein